MTALHNQGSSYPMTVDDYLFLESTTKSAKTMPSPACKPHFPTRPIERIFFLHMRKAGGTIIRTYLDQVARKYNLTFDAREGGKTVEEPMDNATLYVTNLREPVARTISHYKYDQRWDCARQLVNDSFVPSLSNVMSTMEDFLNFTTYKYPNTIKYFWTCPTNCYAHWATGDYKPLSPDKPSCLHQQLRKNEITLLQQAHANLLNYNFIFIQEKLRDKTYVEQVEDMFGVKGLASRSIPPTCGESSKAANDKFPLKISKETMQRIQDCNTPDSVLYKQLTSCPFFDFPKHNSSSVFRGSSTIASSS